jgi:hypothetical protein
MRTSFFEAVRKVVLEGKAEELKAKYEDQLPEDVIDKVFEIGADVDPGNPNKYTPWMLKMLADRKANEGMNSTAMLDIFSEDIKKFDEYCKKNKIENKDLYTYKTVEALVDVVRTVEYKAKTELSRSQQKKGILGLTDIPKEDIIFENDKVVLVFPANRDHSCKYGRGTNWCTAAMGNRNYFNRYFFDSKVNLYYVFTKVDITGKGVDKDIVSNFSVGFKDDEAILAIVVYPDKRVELYNKQDVKYATTAPAAKKLFKFLELPSL